MVFRYLSYLTYVERVLSKVEAIGEVLELYTDLIDSFVNLSMPTTYSLLKLIETLQQCLRCHREGTGDEGPGAALVSRHDAMTFTGGGFDVG
ncbi:hypothetical protein MRX96_014195 [Rhipicephalus microplus]